MSILYVFLYYFRIFIMAAVLIVTSATVIHFCFYGSYANEKEGEDNIQVSMDV